MEKKKTRLSRIEKKNQTVTDREKKTRLSRTEKKYYTNLNFTECALMGLSKSYLAKKHLCVQYILFSYQWVCNGICLVYETDICAQKRTASSVTVFMRRFKLFLRHGSTVHNCAFIQIGQIQSSIGLDHLYFKQPFDDHLVLFLVYGTNDGKSLFGNGFIKMIHQAGTNSLPRSSGGVYIGVYFKLTVNYPRHIIRVSYCYFFIIMKKHK